MSTATITLSSKGQVVIPKEIRDELHWEAGTELTLIANASGVTLKAVEKNPAAIWRI
ncbi:AbrB/MazE/SpoVT family DNA-binding domain-containing protein [Methylomonas koyamae]|uniref:AbrB/MazE/SpoVT family DNA-binding domain-containing protein n=1 Tax=Methylomonas koyamae TaxID=702114 RepID=UPI000A635DDF|nr:AbrB/MazE/SpoVT family DNA-binding domain-containing protein [Methylomonas koyamae]